MTIRRSHPVAVLGSLTVLLALTLTGCGGGASESKSAGVSSSGGGALDSKDAPAADRVDFTGRDDPVQARAVVSTGSVDLVSKDVAGARAEVDALLTEHDGFLADERTSTDSHGAATEARLVLRVPSERFDAVMTALSRIGRLQDSSRKAKDVTTEVIDVQQRVRAQQVGLRRLEVLLGRAKSLPDLLKIERDVTQRQADLDSLKSQRAYLTSQTTLATITVHIGDVPRPAAHADHTGFTAGLGAGWDGLTTFVGWVVTAVGALLPFTLLALVLAPLAWTVRRTLRRRRPVAEPAQPTG
jgi:hypothetical protein